MTETEAFTRADEHFRAGQALKTGLLDVRTILRARAEFAAATELRPDWAEAWFELGRTSSWVSDLEQATKAIEKALELDNTHAGAWFVRYSLYANQDEYENALAALERAVELNPHFPPLVYELERIRSAPKRKSGSIIKFPVFVESFADLDQAIENFVTPAVGNTPAFLNEESVIFALGSCFARSVAVALRRLGVTTELAEQVEDVNSSYANRFFFDWILDDSTPHEETFRRVFGEAYREQMRAAIEHADAVIFSLGVAPCYFDVASGNPVLTLGINPLFALNAGNLEFRTTTVEENVANLDVIREKLHAVNPKAMFVLTVSPVPLRGTVEYPSAIVADCVSKSVLRTAADLFMREGHPRTLYWPSFEIVKWLGPYREPIFGADDRSAFHVNQAVVDAVFRAFLKRFGDQKLNARIT